MHWRRKWQPTPVFLPGESQGWRSLVGCRLWGRTESDTTEATWQQQQQQHVHVNPKLPIYLPPTHFPYTTLFRSEVAQSCPTLSDPLDCSPPGSYAHGIFQARVLEWGAITFSGHVHTTIYKTGNQQGPTVYHRELYPIFSNKPKWENNLKKNRCTCICN